MRKKRAAGLGKQNRIVHDHFPASPLVIFSRTVRISEPFHADVRGPILTTYLKNVLEYMDGQPLYAANKNLKKMTRSFAEAVESCIAWDVERAAFWSRMAANAGFIPEDEAWEILRVCHAYVKSNFSSWAEYLVSFMIGRSLVMCNPDHEQSMREIVDNACLLGEPKWGAVWALHPLG
jgi:hypothetical protein